MASPEYIIEELDKQIKIVCSILESVLNDQDEFGSVSAETLNRVKDFLQKTGMD